VIESPSAATTVPPRAAAGSVDAVLGSSLSEPQPASARTTKQQAAKTERLVGSGEIPKTEPGKDAGRPAKRAATEAAKTEQIKDAGRSSKRAYSSRT
jgi:hypothetical protein